MYRYFIYFALLLFVACGGKSPQESDFASGDLLAVDQMISDVSGYNYRNRINIVDKLYDEALDNDKELKKLDDLIAKSGEFQNDLTEEYFEFRNMNNNYYASVGAYINRIQDENKRDNIRTLLGISKESYESEIKGHESISENWQPLRERLQDQSVLLKLVVTEQLMRAYQDELPEINKLRAVNVHYQDLIDQSDKYVNKKH